MPPVSAVSPRNGYAQRSDWTGLDVVCIISILAGMNSREIIRRLEKEGWRLVRSKGSHRQYKHPAKAGLITVPHPRRDFPAGTLRAIFRQAGWEKRR